MPKKANNVLEIDPRIAVLGNAYLDQGVDFGLYTSDSLDPPDFESLPFKRKNAACFARLVDNVNFQPYPNQNKKRKPPFNKVLYRLKTIPREQLSRKGNTYPITLEEAKIFVRLLKEYGLTQSHIDENVLKESSDGESIEGSFVMDLEDRRISEIYMNLSSIRDLREYNNVVKWTLHLFKDHQINFYAAYCMACAMIGGASGHHFVTVNGRTRAYGAELSANSCLEHKIAIGFPISLQRFATNPKKYDDRKIIGYDKTKGGAAFNCSGTISRICRLPYEISLEDLKKVTVDAAIMSENDKQAERFLELSQK